MFHKTNGTNKKEVPQGFILALKKILEPLRTAIIIMCDKISDTVKNCHGKLLFFIQVIQVKVAFGD